MTDVLGEVSSSCINHLFLLPIVSELPVPEQRRVLISVNVLIFFFFFLQCWGGVDALGITLLGHTLSDDRGKPLSISSYPTMMGWPGAG